MHHTTALIASRRARGRGAADAGLLRRVLLIGLLIALLAGAVFGVRKLMSESSNPKRQVARIAILPDTAPPPPPPPPKERKEEPPKPDKQNQAVPEQQVKPPPNQTAEPLKMEGAAGTGPSAFAAGSVSQDYKGGAPTIGGTGTGTASPVDRAQERLYANSVRQMLRDEIERQLQQDAGELTAAFALWVSPEGRVTRWEFDGKDTPLDERHQAALKLALDRSADTLRLPAPLNLPQPMRFRLTVRPAN